MSHSSAPAASRTSARAARLAVRFVILVFAVVLGVGSFAANRRPSKLIVVGDESYAPYEYRDEQGQAAGIAVDIWRLWSRKTGIPVEYRCMVWADALDAVKSGKADVVGNIFRTKEREQVFDFSTPYSEVTTHVFFDQRIFGIKDLSNAIGFNVGVVESDSSEEFVRRNYPNLDLVRFPSNIAMVQAALDGRIKIFVSDTPIAMFLLLKQGKVEDFRHTVSPLYVSQVHAAVRRGNNEMLDLVNDGFSKISKSEIDLIVSQWTGTPVTNRMAWRAVLFWGGVVTLVLVLVFLWNLSLRHRVASAIASLEASEKEARKNEERFRLVVEASKDAIIAVDSQGMITMINPAALDMFGYDETEVQKHSINDLVPGMLGDHSSELNPTHTGDHPHPAIHEKLAVRKDGSPFTVECSLSRILNSSEIYLLTVIRDITFRKQLESCLNQSQKLEVVGQLAGGVAHDVNNLLSPIMIYIDLLLAEIEPGNPHRRMLTQMRKAAESAKGITQQLLAFGRRQMLEMKIINLNEAIESFEKILKSTIRENIILRIDLAPDLWNIKADSVQLQQILMNLSLNAQDAMPQGGTLIISTGNEEVAGDFAFRKIPPDSYVKLTVEDTGIGMDQSVLGSIFEPFFTTKEKGRGTGLGLSTVDGIVRQHQGTISAASEPGKGSVFTILFPRSMEEVEMAPAEEASQAPLAPKGSILVVEDNEMLLDVAAEILEKAGYDVIGLTSAKEAVRILEARKGDIELLLTDVIMPGINGRELAGQLLAVKPSLKVIYMSGYPEDVIAMQGIMDSGTCFIQKPFNMDDLLARIQSVLLPVG